MTGGAGVQGAGQAAHVVLVGVSADHIVQLVNALLLQVGDHQAAVGHVSTVNEHGAVPAHQQSGVGLAHVDEVYGQGGAVGHSGRCGGRGRGEQVAARQGDEQAEQGEQGGNTSFHVSSFSTLVYIMCMHQYKPKRRKREEARG